MKLRDFLTEIDKIHKELHTSKPMICGGIPRDKALNILDKIGDLDLTTGDKTINPLFVGLTKELNKKYKIDYDIMGDGHKTLKFNNFKVDFSSNFNTPGIENLLKKQGISNPTDLEKEMFSRDFTVNSLLLDFDLKTFSDPTKKGFKDLKSKIIDTCLDPAVTFANFRNRVVRAIYLAAKLDFDLHPRVEAWIKEYPVSIQFSTHNSMNEKIEKALSYNPDKTIFLIKKLNLTPYVVNLPSLDSYRNKL